MAITELSALTGATMDHLVQPLAQTDLELPAQDQPLLLCKMFQSLNHPCGPLLHLLQLVHVSLRLGSPEIDTELQSWLHHC